MIQLQLLFYYDAICIEGSDIVDVVLQMHWARHRILQARSCLPAHVVKFGLTMIQGKNMCYMVQKLWNVMFVCECFHPLQWETCMRLRMYGTYHVGTNTCRKMKITFKNAIVFMVCVIGCSTIHCGIVFCWYRREHKHATNGKNLVTWMRLWEC